MITGPNYEPTSIMVGSIYGLALIMAGSIFGPALIMAGSINGFLKVMNRAGPIFRIEKSLGNYYQIFGSSMWVGRKSKWRKLKNK